MASLPVGLYRQIVEQTHSVIFITDPEGKILFVNDFAAHFFGYSEAELLGKNILGTIVPELESTGRELAPVIKDLPHNPERYIYSTHECLRKNGDFVWLTWSNTPFYDEAGKVSKILSIGNDITSRKLAEESYKKLLRLSQEELVSCSDELEITKGQLQQEVIERKLLAKKQAELEEHLQHTEKLQAIGQLAGGIAHDFNNQLACIIGYTDIMLNRSQEESTRRYADLIVKAANRSAKLTAQLLNFARKVKSQEGLVNVHRIINDVISLLSQSLAENIEIRQFLSAEPPITLGDPLQLQNALLNLTVNAMDAMPAGGQIIFTTEKVVLDDEFVKTCRDEIVPGTYLKIAVIDTGSGIDKKLQKRIFEPFFTTKNAAEATGMGLSVVRDIVRRHQGLIDISSAPDKGTTVILYLPLADKPQAILQDSPPVPAKQQARILLVDDDETARNLAAEMLLDFGYKVKTCTDGIEAVQYYRDSWRQTDLVILDLIMPKMGGFDTFLALREINPHVKALVACGHSLGQNGRKILEAGVFAFVQKPFTLKNLSQQVANCLAGASKPLSAAPTA